jgi:hypothetical protein
MSKTTTKRGKVSAAILLLLEGKAVGLGRGFRLLRYEA